MQLLWDCFRIDPGMERKSVCQCISSYGANIWSLLVSDVMLYMLDHTGATSVIALNLFLVFAGTYGIWRCYKNYQKRGCTRLI